MTVELLDPSRAAELQREHFTYPEVGRSAGPLPDGYQHIARTRTLSGSSDFDVLVDRLMTWQVQSRAGLRVAASSQRVEADAVTLMRLGVGPLAITIPCRVVYVIEEADRRGFAYGTLPGHPESGEESFVLERTAAGRIEFTVSAFSRPATRLARLGGPMTTLMQRLMTDRYLRALS
ncbi:DUF1990 family protein [uncultured Jatrophihabitans sp.]|uniref:DUF1990 family protein n=1 Tax=uncultured Jatrophihabitans sp. TaxID=1610747 RepID=UPI0035CAEE55